MSLDAIRWAWRQEVSSSNERLVLLSYADRADENHCAYPSSERLHKDTLLDRKTIFKSIASLVDQGLMRDTGERKGRTGRVIVYKLIGVDGREEVETVPDKEYLTGSEKVKQSQKRNSTENGIVPYFPSNDTKNGTIKQYQKRYSEPTNILTNQLTPATAVEKIPITWRPDQETIKLLETFSGIPPPFLNELIPEFIGYWRTRQIELRQLDAKFIAHAQRQWSRRKHTWRPQGESPGGGSPADQRAAVDRALQDISDTNW